MMRKSTPRPVIRPRPVPTGQAAVTAEALEGRRLLAAVSGRVFSDFDGHGSIEPGESGLAGWTVYRDVDTDGTLDVNTPVSRSAGDVPKPIADNATTTSAVAVSGLGGTVYDVNVTLDVSHTFDRDLVLTLTGPGGQSVILADRVGRSGDHFTGTVFDDEAAVPITGGVAPFARSFQPASALAAFDGTAPNGNWTLGVQDTGLGDTGTINSWSVQITTSEQSTTTDAAGNYTLLNLPAGTHQIRTVLRPGYERTVPANGLRTVTVTAAQTQTDQDFGNRLPPGEIRGSKWADFDADGTRDANEPGLPGVRIYLDANASGAFDTATERSTTTDADGNYVLTDVPPGNHLVGEVGPAGSTRTFPGPFGVATGPTQVAVAVSASDAPAAVAPAAGDSSSKSSLTSPLATADSGRISAVFGPGTSPEQARAALTKTGSRIRAGGAGRTDFAFEDTSRWTRTATDGAGLNQGDGTRLTWTVVPDNTPLPTAEIAGESADNSNLRSFLTGIYGSEAMWRAVLQRVFDAWSQNTGVTFTYMAADDMARVGGQSPGVANVRADIRIGGHRIDGNAGAGNTLLYGYKPDVGDLVIDTADAFFSGAAGRNNDSLGNRNVIAHELGHALGLDHVAPVLGTKLMEPSVSLNIDGPQPDDVLAANRGYGDRYEKTRPGNETPAAAASLGTLANGTTNVRTVSIDDNADVDVFRFSVAAGKRLTLGVSPVGSTYLSGPEGAEPSPFDSRAQSDLRIQLLAADGTTVLASANAGGIGQGEAILNYPAGAGGTLYVKVTGTADAAQMYDLGVTVTDAVAGSHSVNVASNQTVFNVDFANHVTRGVVGRHVFYNRSAYDGSTVAVPDGPGDDAAIAPDKRALPPGHTATGANYTGYSKGINGVIIDVAGLTAAALQNNDFTFRVGNDNTPGGWSPAPDPAAITVREAAGAGGSDRVTITWPDNVIRNTWLQVTVLANTDTNLPAADVFYFGNAVGETFDKATTFAVNSGDVVRTRNAQARPTTIQGLFDHNRDGRVNTVDLALARNNQSFTLTRIAPPTGVAASVLAKGATESLKSRSRPRR